ncbi:MAG: hypothetical protein MEP57_06760 [Microvirga sp.]|nr:hypothetical protein [Microvirga sp.]
MLATLRSLGRAGSPARSGNSALPDEAARPIARAAPDARPEEHREEHPETPFSISVFDRGEPCFAQNFAAGEVVIGGDSEADIVITDVDTPEVAVLRLERIGAACLVTITALCGGVVARGRELPVGRPLVFPDGARFTVAEDYAFEIAFAPAQSPVTGRRSAPIALLGVAAACAAAGWILSEPTPRQAGTPPTTAVEADSRPGSASLLDAAELRAPPVAADDDPVARLALAETDLRARLVSANLLPPLRVTRRSEALAVEGGVTPEERDRLVDVLQAFHARARVPLEMTLESDPPTAPFFASVVLRPQTFVIGADGRRYGLGQRLPDGGLIEKIDETSIVVNRDGLRERVDYAR